MAARPWILGLGCGHNGSACLLHGDEIVAAVQEERLFRTKRKNTTGRHTKQCIRYVLDAGGIGPADLSLISYSLTRGHDGHLDEDIYLNDCLRAGLANVPTTCVTHHYAHAVSAFATSGFRRAAVLVIDGAGCGFQYLPPAEQAAVMNRPIEPEDAEWMSYYEAEDTRLTPVLKQVKRIGVPDTFMSLGDMYGDIGFFLFGSFLEGPGKVMGLAPYGRPLIPLDTWLTVDDRGLVRFPLGAHCAVQSYLTSPGDFETRANLAASVQHATEYALCRTVAELRRRSTSDHLCYAGGVALNSVANERVVRHGGFDHVFIFPAAEDSGIAVGAAFHGLWQLTAVNTRKRLNRDAFGRTYPLSEIDAAVARMPAVRVVDHGDDLLQRVTQLLCDGKIVAWFDGGSELGPRALGQRSIFCDPRRADGKDVMNARVKHREGFRPFAPAVLLEHVHDWFEVPPRYDESPFMLRVWPFRDDRGARVPAVAHVDNTARVQTLTPSSHPRLYALVETFYRETGVPMLLNTSFNVAGEPIVESPDDALACLLQTGIDYLVLGERLVKKADDYRSLLDLTPQVTAVSVTLRLPTGDGPLRRWSNDAAVSLKASMVRRGEPAGVGTLLQLGHRAGRPYAYATVLGRWGEAAVPLDGAHLDLLQRIDGTTTGRALLAQLPDRDELSLLEALIRLARAGVIQFS